MDEFVFDLDKALDELEENEGKEQQYSSHDAGGKSGTSSGLQQPSAQSLDYVDSHCDSYGNLNGLGPSEYKDSTDQKLENRLGHSMGQNQTCPTELGVSESDDESSSCQKQHTEHLQNGLDSSHGPVVTDASTSSATNSLDHVNFSFSASSMTSKQEATVAGHNANNCSSNGILETDANTSVPARHGTDLTAMESSHDLDTSPNEDNLGIDSLPDKYNTDTDKLHNSKSHISEQEMQSSSNTKGHPTAAPLLNEGHHLVEQSAEHEVSDSRPMAGLDETDCCMLNLSCNTEDGSVDMPHGGSDTLEMPQPESMKEIQSTSPSSLLVTQEPKSSNSLVATYQSVPADTDTNIPKDDGQTCTAAAVSSGGDRDECYVEPEMNKKDATEEISIVDKMEDTADQHLETRVMGFSDVDDTELSSHEMDPYLSTFISSDNCTEYDSKPVFSDEMTGAAHGSSNYAASAASPEHDPEITVKQEVPTLDERRGSGGSVEKFLAPVVITPGITTPIEDPGYSKVPGYVPELSVTMEEDSEDTDRDHAQCNDVKVKVSDNAPQVSKSSVENPNSSLSAQHEKAQQQTRVSSADKGGARPKEPLATSARISRPSSLLGLSTPGLPSLTPPQAAVVTEVFSVAKSQQAGTALQNASVSQAGMQFCDPSARDSGIVADSVDVDSGTSSPKDEPVNTRNMHDMMNTQLAAHCNLPLMKKQMNLEIKQRLKGEQQRMDKKHLVEVNKGGQMKMDSAQPTKFTDTGTAALTQTATSSALPPAAREPSQDDIPQGQQPTTEPEPGLIGEPTVTEPLVPSPPTSANINLAITQLGKVAPVWVPDAEAPVCMQCEARFTFTKRRHHCRACGKVFCNSCCNLRSKLAYMDNKEARVCSKCYQDLVRAQFYERMHQQGQSPNPNNPSEYCSTVPPLQQAAGSLNAPPPTVMVPSGVLRKDGNQRRAEGPKQVMFSDGIRPGGDLTELDGVPDRRPPIHRQTRKVCHVEKSGDKDASPHRRTSEQSKPICLIPEQGLPPVLLSTGVKGDFSIEENPDPEKVLPKIRSTEDPEPVVFAINKNLFVLVKIVTLDCCVNRVCWCFSTKGMSTVGQDDIVIVLECLPDEKTIPRDIFCHLSTVYEEASKGNIVSHLGHTIFAQGFLDSRDHSGFLYINASYQCLQKLILPQPPFIFGILLQRWETPWAKVFPIRLMLRLGAEYRYYPCPLISVRFRKPVFGEIGHTIMNLLADFRNYQYMLPQVPGVTIHMGDKETFINFPRNRYNNIMKVLANSNDHVMALAANFSLKADSHLVCLQNDDGNYETQAINIQNKPRKVTGASFVVFNGAFKQTGGLRAKSSIIEDGLMVQITAEMMVELKEAMKSMTDYVIECGVLNSKVPEETVTVKWVEDDRYVNIGVKSPIDDMPMDGIESIRIHTSTDFAGDKHMIRWTECFFVQTPTDGNSQDDPVDLSRLAESLAHALCVALAPYLDKLQGERMSKIGLRATIDPDKTCYEVGSNGNRLPDEYMDVLDNALIPVIHNAASHNQDGPVILELVFHIIE